MRRYTLTTSSGCMIPKRSLQRFPVYHFVRHIAFVCANAEQNSLCLSLTWKVLVTQTRWEMRPLSKAMGEFCGFADVGFRESSFMQDCCQTDTYAIPSSVSCNESRWLRRTYWYWQSNPELLSISKTLEYRKSRFVMLQISKTVASRDYWSSIPPAAAALA